MHMHTYSYRYTHIYICIIAFKFVHLGIEELMELQNSIILTHYNMQEVLQK